MTIHIFIFSQEWLKNEDTLTPEVQHIAIFFYVEYIEPSFCGQQEKSVREEKKKRDDSILTDDEQKILRVHLASFLTGEIYEIPITFHHFYRLLLFDKPWEDMLEFVAANGLFPPRLFTSPDFSTIIHFATSTRT
jgi:hypothetical protein